MLIGRNVNMEFGNLMDNSKGGRLSPGGGGIEEFEYAVEIQKE
jgi:hypothetical protein